MESEFKQACKALIWANVSLLFALASLVLEVSFVITIFVNLRHALAIVLATVFCLVLSRWAINIANAEKPDSWK